MLSVVQYHTIVLVNQPQVCGLDSLLSRHFCFVSFCFESHIFELQSETQGWSDHCSLEHYSSSLAKVDPKIQVGIFQVFSCYFLSSIPKSTDHINLVVFIFVLHHHEGLSTTTNYYYLHSHPRDLPLQENNFNSPSLCSAGIDGWMTCSRWTHHTSTLQIPPLSIIVESWVEYCWAHLP